MHQETNNPQSLAIYFGVDVFWVITALFILAVGLTVYINIGPYDPVVVLMMSLAWAALVLLLVGNRQQLNMLGYHLRWTLTYAMKNKWDLVELHLQRARENTPSTKRDKLRLANLLLSIAAYQKAQAQYAPAVRLYEEAIDLFEAHSPDNVSLIAWIYTSLGSCLLEWGRFDDAESVINQAYEIASDADVPHRWLRPLCLCDLSWIAIGRGQLKEAEQFIDQAKQSFIPTEENNWLTFFLLSGEAEIRFWLEDWQEAETLVHKALAIPHLDYILGGGYASQCMLQLGMLFFRAGDFQHARSYTLASIENGGVSQLPEAPWLNKNYLWLARIELAEGNHQQAEELFQKGFRLREQCDYPDTFFLVEHLKAYADYLESVDQCEEAENYRQRANRVSVPISSGIKSAKMLDGVSRKEEESC